MGKIFDISGKLIQRLVRFFNEIMGDRHLHSVAE